MQAQVGLGARTAVEATIMVRRDQAALQERVAKLEEEIARVLSDHTAILSNINRLRQEVIDGYREQFGELEEFIRRQEQRMQAASNQGETIGRRLKQDTSSTSEAEEEHENGGDTSRTRRDRRCRQKPPHNEERDQQLAEPADDGGEGKMPSDKQRPREPAKQKDLVNRLLKEAG